MRKEKLTLKDLKKILLDNFVNENGNLDISGLDFGDFDGIVNISYMKVKGDLFQCNQKVGGDLLQNDQKVGGDIIQSFQRAGGRIIQNYQVEGERK